MDLINDRKVGFLSAVNEFRRTRLYKGVMPNRLVRTCDEQVVDSVFSQGLVAKFSGKYDDGSRIEGVVLTDKGMAFLQSY